MTSSDRRPGASAGPAEDDLPVGGPGVAETLEAAPTNESTGAGAHDVDVEADEVDIVDVELVEDEVLEELVVDEMARLRVERDEFLDMLRRVQADFENYRKRVDRQQGDLRARAAESVVTSILPALDAFELARTHLLEDSLSPDSKALLQAAALLRDALEREGLEVIDTVGEAFDPTAHDAVEHVDADSGDDESEGTAGDGPSGPVILGVLRPGYRWKGRVLRPAMVRVQG